MGIKEEIVKGIEGVLQGIVDGISNALGTGINSVVDLTTHVPKPQPSDGIIFGKPTNGLWEIIYQARTESAPYLLVLGLIILSLSWFVKTIGESYTSLFDQLDKKRATTGLFAGFLAMYFLWWGFSALLWFSDGMTQFILDSTGSTDWSTIINNNFEDALGGSIFVTALIAFVGVGLVLLTAILHVLRLFGIYSIMYVLPILIGAYFGGIPVAKTVAKKSFKYLFVFATIPIPTAILLGLSSTLIQSDSLGLVGAEIGSTLIRPFIVVLPLLVGFVIPIFMLRSITAVAAIGGLNRAASNSVPDSAKSRIGSAKQTIAGGAKNAATSAAGAAGGTAAGAATSAASGTKAAVTQPDTSYQNAKQGLKDTVPGASDINDAIETADDRASWKATMAQRKGENIKGEYKDFIGRGTSAAKEFIQDTVDTPNNPQTPRLDAGDDPTALPEASAYRDETRPDARPNQGTAEAGPVPNDTVGRQDLKESLTGVTRDNKEPTIISTSDADVARRVQGDTDDIGDTAVGPESARSAGENIQTPERPDEPEPSSDSWEDAASSPSRSPAEQSAFEFGANQADESVHPATDDDTGQNDPVQGGPSKDVEVGGDDAPDEHFLDAWADGEEGQ